MLERILTFVAGFALTLIVHLFVRIPEVADAVERTFMQSVVNFSTTKMILNSSIGGFVFLWVGEMDIDG